MNDMKLNIFLILVICIVQIGIAQEASLGNTQSLGGYQSWKGFERIAFKIGKHDAYYVKPTKAMEGNPWIWRASFPDWHTDMDSILLAKGFHVVFVDVDNEYGSPYSMQNPQSKGNACRIVHFLVNK
jgi:hypothetical protein